MDHDFKMITIIWILLSTNIFFQPELLGKSCFEFIHTEDQVIYTSNFHSNSIINYLLLLYQMNTILMKIIPTLQAHMKENFDQVVKMKGQVRNHLIILIIMIIMTNIIIMTIIIVFLIPRWWPWCTDSVQSLGSGSGFALKPSPSSTLTLMR